MKTFDDVWKEIDKGSEVYWKNPGYKVHPIPIHRGNKPENSRGGMALRVTCTHNYFGSFLQSSEIGELFTA